MTGTTARKTSGTGFRKRYEDIKRFNPTGGVSRGELISVQQAMEPVAGEIRDETGAGYGEEQPPQGDAENCDQHDRASFLLRTSGR